MTTTEQQREQCRVCGATWPVSMRAREGVVCRDCASTPRLPTGEVRRSPEGVVAVRVGGTWSTWRVIGEDPERTVMHGWREDRHVTDWQVIGNVHDMTLEA